MARTLAGQFAFAAIGALLLVAHPANAQRAGSGPEGRMLRVGFGGGVSVPTSNTADALRHGINGQAYLLLDLGMLAPLRFNVGYQRFDFDEAVLEQNTGQSTILSGVAGLTLGLLRLGPLQPYVTAGVGAFNVSNEIQGEESDSQMHFGIDGGGGLNLRIGRLEAFIEGRVQNVYTEQGLIDSRTITSVPVTFGILF
jgi:opacity protein-like surface antigen